jgi:Zn-dependent membrane protease YugP
MPYFFYDQYYILLVIPAMLVALGRRWGEFHFRRYSGHTTARGITARRQPARSLTTMAASHRVEHVAGSLTDHYDPKGR